MSGVMRSVSAATAIEHLLGVGERAAAGVQQGREVEEDVGGLLVDAVVALLAGGADHLLGLLLDLLAGERRVLEQLDDVGAVGSLGGALGDRALQRRQGLVRGGPLGLAAVEAGARAGVAGGAGRLDEG